MPKLIGSVTSEKLKPFKIHGLKVKTTKQHYSGLKGSTYFFDVYKGKKLKNELAYNTRNLKNAKKKLKKELSSQYKKRKKK